MGYEDVVKTAAPCKKVQQIMTLVQSCNLQLAQSITYSQSYFCQNRGCLQNIGVFCRKQPTEPTFSSIIFFEENISLKHNTQKARGPLSRNQYVSRGRSKRT